MKKKLLSAALLLSSTLAAVGTAHAAIATTTLDVTALVGQVCTVSTTPVNFGFVDPAIGNMASGSITVICNPGTPYTVALGAGQHFVGNRQLSDGVGNVMIYDLINPLTGMLWGDDWLVTPWPAYYAISSGTNVYTVNGNLLPTIVPSGAYSDVVSVTVTY